MTAAIRAFALVALCACGPTPAASAPAESEATADAGAEISTVDVAADVPVLPADYSVDGPFAVSSTTVTVSGGSADFSLTAYLPVSAKPAPVVILEPGLQQPAAAYAVYGHRLATHGIACFLRDDPGIAVMTNEVIADLAFLVTTWLPASPFKEKLDLARVGLCGHSRGGKATLVAAETVLAGKTKAWFGLDPVDASFVAGDGQGRDKIAEIGIPIAMMGAEVSGACSPAADNYAMLFARAASPAVSLTAVGAGHTHFEQQDQCVACGLCTPDGPADKAAVLDLAIRYVTAFFARELLGDAHVGADFAGAGASADVKAGVLTRAVK